MPSSSMMRVKICGLTNVHDALFSCAAGADAIGLVFYPKSSRFVSPEQAAEIVDALPPFVQSVGLFVNASTETVGNILKTVKLDLLQFHGDEDSVFCESFCRPYIKAIRMKPGINLESVMASFPSAKGFLLDTYTPGIPGGTGESFNWQDFPSQADKPLILAGGLNAQNVAEAIAVCCPYAVDVSGGVEQGPGRKSKEQVAAFINQAKQ